MSISPENGSSLDGGKLIVVDGAIGASVAAVSRMSVIVAFLVEVARCPTI